MMGSVNEQEHSKVTQSSADSKDLQVKNHKWGGQIDLRNQMPSMLSRN